MRHDRVGRTAHVEPRGRVFDQCLDRRPDRKKRLLIKGGCQLVAPDVPGRQVDHDEPIGPLSEKSVPLPGWDKGAYTFANMPSSPGDLQFEPPQGRQNNLEMTMLVQRSFRPILSDAD